MIKAVLFDLDGTLINMDEDAFKKLYFKLIGKKLAEYGQDPQLAIAGVINGVKAMQNNDGSQENRDAFWGELYKLCPNAPKNIVEIFDSFYRNEFLQTAVTCGKIECVNEVLAACRNLGLKVILSSNPMFPLIGMQQRLKFGNIDSKLFNHITTYDEYHYAKPNPKFLEELLAKNGLKSNEVVYFGNSEQEDLTPARKLGIACYLVGKNPDETNSTEKRYQISDVPALLKQIIK